jgi:hypothetical protein
VAQDVLVGAQGDPQYSGCSSSRSNQSLPLIKKEWTSPKVAAWQVSNSCRQWLPSPELPTTDRLQSLVIDRK